MPKSGGACRRCRQHREQASQPLRRGHGRLTLQMPDTFLFYDLETYGKLSLGVENLLNKQYILSWSQLAGYQNYWAGRGRVTSLTYSITF